MKPIIRMGKKKDSEPKCVSLVKRYLKSITKMEGLHTLWHESGEKPSEDGALKITRLKLACKVRALGLLIRYLGMLNDAKRNGRSSADLHAQIIGKNCLTKNVNI